MAAGRGNSIVYSKLEKEDREEMVHQKAQFLINKILQQADRERRRNSFVRIRLVRVTVKIGNRLKKLRKSFLVVVGAGKDGVCKNLMCRLRSLRRFLFATRRSVSGIPPPLFTLDA